MVVVVALMCVSSSGSRTMRSSTGAGTALLGVLALEDRRARRWHSLGRFLPLLGISVFLLLDHLAQLAGAFLADR